MAVIALAAGLTMHSSTEPTLPMTARTHSKVPSNAELDAIELADCGHLADNQGGTSEPQSLPPIAIGSRTPKTPDELESSAPVTPIHRTAVTGIVPGWGYPTMNKWRVLACCLIYFGNGMNDSAPGALIPYMETYYHIDYAIVSMIWVANAAGFISAAFFVDLFRDRLGRAKTLMLAEAVISAGCVLIVCSPPYPAVVVAYFLVGYGTAVNLALNSVFSANLANATVILGVTNGCYGIGGILGPFVATALVSNGVLWSRFFLVVLTIRIVCFFFAGWSFWNYEKEGVTQFANSLQLIASRQAASEYGEPGKLKLLSRALKNKTTIIGALFIFAYQGGEVAESGWFISYLIDYRNGDPAHVGYVTSGFWAGITLGRFVLVHLAHRIGEKKSVFALGAGVIGLQLVAWLVRDVIGDAVAVSILGFLLGPLYPCAASVFTRLLPGNLQTTAMGFIAGAGSSGGAVIPFIVGIIAQSKGTVVLHPINVGVFGIMLGCWALLPRLHKRNE